MEGYKVNRRTRSQPFDLRRKVLLKNFLREQMTYIPQTRLMVTIQDLDASFAEEPCNSSDLEENLEELNDENCTSSASNTGISSLDDVQENNFKINSNPVISKDSNNSEDPVSESKLFNLGNFMSLRSGFKKSKSKSIKKAKKVCKTIRNPFKRDVLKNSIRSLSLRNKVLKKNLKDNTEDSPKSLLSLIKSRKGRKKFKKLNSLVESTTNIQTTPVNDSNQTLNQAVQTDDSWTRQELNRVEQSNKLLQEENRLLSESLSYFMRSSSLDSQLNYCGSPIKSSNCNINNLNQSSEQSDIPSCSNDYNNNKWTPRSKVLRSKSVNDQSGYRNKPRYCYRTRSMNCHNIHESSSNNVHNGVSSLNFSSFQPPSQPLHILRTRRNSVLSTLNVNSTGRVIQRRSSMPERTLSENDRSRICRRSGSVRDTRRTPFHALPAEAFY